MRREQLSSSKIHMTMDAPVRVSAAAAARVNLRELLRVSAVESYVRNFHGESHRLQELLEVTLCYGIHSISSNFQLKGMTVDELLTVTKHEKTKTRDFFVRNASKQRSSAPFDPLADPQLMFVKPSRSWRDGNARTSECTRSAKEEGGGSVQGGLDDPKQEVFFLPNEAHKDKLDEIDFYTRVLGKELIDVAWTTYAARGTSYLDGSHLEERMIRVDQRKRFDLVPHTELPVCSFVDFLHAYVKRCVVGTPCRSEDDDTVSETSVSSAVATNAASMAKSAGKSVSIRRTSGEAHIASAVKARPSPRSREHTRSLPRSKSVEHVQSKIQPELRAHREKLLRVKKTQTQLMKESLARARLAEYAAKRDEEIASRPLGAKRMPLDKITPGATALEIVDDFIRSPLMDKFGRDVFAPTTRDTPNGLPTRKDPLKEELYGIAAHDDSFIGCKTPSVPAPREPTQTKKPPTRDYSGWLGDFGPKHTKTIHSAWLAGDCEADESDDNGDRGSIHSAHQPVTGLSTRTRKTDRFEWKFDLLAPRSTRGSGPKSLSSSSVLDNENGDSIDSLSDFSSASRSETSDPVYRWLQTAVQ